MKKLWELQHQVVCKVIGMCFGPKDLAKIQKKFLIRADSSLSNSEAVLHSTVVHLCSTESRISRHIQKMIQLRYSRYEKKLSAVDPTELVDWITEDRGHPSIPLWAILWDLAMRDLQEGILIESVLTGFLHILEHRLMKEYWEASAQRAERIISNEKSAEELTLLKRRILDLQAELDVNRKVIKRLKMQVSDQGRVPGRDSGPQCTMTLNARQTDKIRRLQELLNAERCRRQNVEQECCRLGAEIRALSEEANFVFSGGVSKDETPKFPECPLREKLREKHVTMVGGINSLECHYRALVESMGGTFQRHNGNCSGGACLIEDCIRKADLVVCPVEVNSHNAMKSVKKLCRNHGIPCCFPRTAGLSGLRTALAEHFSEAECA
jgi:hypothetical protein